MQNLEIRSVLVSEAYTNCYLVKNKETGDGFIVDPGDNEMKISMNISKMEMEPKAILLTHGHFDHIGAAEALKERYDIPIYAAEEEEQTLLNSRHNLTAYHYDEPMVMCADKYLKDGERFSVAGIQVQFILTPGHTPGSGCFYLKDENVLFSGDTLFQASYGRTDFPGGSEARIFKSIREKLLTLQPETDVFPGHMGQTTIADERRYY